LRSALILSAGESGPSGLLLVDGVSVPTADML
jgi:hypothetical protein